MKKNIIKLALISISLIIGANNVNAATMDRHFLYVNDEENGNNQIYKSINGEESQYINIKIRETGAKAFCVDVGANLSGEAGHGTNESLTNYLASSLGENKAAQLSKKINEYLYFGYGYNNKTSYKYDLATQKLIWDEMYDAGYRTGSYSKDMFFYQISGKNPVDISAEMKEIKDNIANYYKTPSFCSSNNKIEINVGETATYTDNNGVLNMFKVSCSGGISCEIAGNNLKVTAQNDSEDNKVEFSKTGGGTTTILYTKSGEQGVVAASGSVEPVKCTFGIDTKVEEVEVHTNPTTGTIAIIIAWIAGLSAFGVSFWYFKKTYL